MLQGSLSLATNHYVDNTKFYEAIKAFRDARVAAKKANQPSPDIPDYIGECFLKIGQHLARLSKFSRYTYRDDMIADGYENCLRYMHNFNPDKYRNPFAYFTRITSHAFVRRIQTEKKHVYRKYKLMEHALSTGSLYADSSDAAIAEDGGMLKFENVQEFIIKFEEHAAKQKARRRVKLSERQKAPSLDDLDAEE